MQLNVGFKSQNLTRKSNTRTLIMPRNEILKAHKHSSGHRDEILKSNLCGCFHCLSIFSPSKIDEWIDDGQCAMCPNCGIDSVIGSESGYPITTEFLKEMSNHWFSYK